MDFCHEHVVEGVDEGDVVGPPVFGAEGRVACQAEGEGVFFHGVDGLFAFVDAGERGAGGGRVPVPGECADARRIDRREGPERGRRGIHA